VGFLSPLVKTIIQKEHISDRELSSIQGTGLEGRITKEDLLGYLKTRRNETATADRALDSAPKAVEVPKEIPASSPLPAAAKPADAKPAAKSGSVQLGAFSSEEKANAVWAGLAGKYGLAGKRVIAVESGGKTLYRLRATSGDPAATCAKLKAAGDACAVVE
jgi:cell division protein FtsN